MNKDEIIQLAQRISSARSSVGQYNVFAEWGMSENDHTKLLVALFRYSDVKNHYPVLRSFLARFAKGRDKKIDFKWISDVEISFNKAFVDNHGKKSLIDGLVDFKVGAHSTRYTIIIENKINGAVDQPKQVIRYITSVLNTGVAPKNVWTFYLTGDGSKEVSQDSYNSDKTECDLGNRFVPISYRDDVIPWLKDDVLKSRCYPESLTSIARQYVDFLDNDMFSENSLLSDQKKLLRYLKIPVDVERIDPQQIGYLYDLRQQVSKLRAASVNDSVKLEVSALNVLYSVLSSILKRLENLAFARFEEQTKRILDEMFGKVCGKLEWKVAHRAVSSEKGYVQIRLVDDWDTVHLEWENFSTVGMLFGHKKKQYSIALHVEDKGLKSQLSDWLMERQLPEGYKKTNRGVCCCIPTSQIPLAKMNDNQLGNFLKEVYGNVKWLFELLVAHIDEYQL